jgi:hypothetical protein
MKSQMLSREVLYSSFLRVDEELSGRRGQVRTMTTEPLHMTTDNTHRRGSRLRGTPITV